MKKLTKTGVSLTVLSAFLFAPIVSYAQLNTNLTGNATTELNTSINASLDTLVDVNSDIKSEVNVNSNTRATVGSEKSSEKRSETSGSLRVNSSGVAITLSSQVKSDEDLEIFSANISDEEGVAKVEIESADEGSEVKVVYKHRGRLFGFIPITLKSTTIVEAKANSDVEVRAKMPWWAFLVAKKNYVKTELESQIKNNTAIKANVSVNASAEAKARVAEAVIAEVEAHANAQAGVNK